MLLTKTVTIKWNSRNKKWYINKGYTFTKIKDEFKVSIEDLSDSSHILIDVRCDGCGKILKGIKWVDYNTHKRKDNTYYCNLCAKNNYQKWTSFYDWCYQNLPKEEADKIMLCWDYEKNIKNGKVLTPKDIAFSSNGINKKGYWFKCLDHFEHVSEQKSINNFVNRNGSIACSQCNTIAITHPYLIKYLVNKNDAYKYSFGSGEYILAKCPDCGYEKEISICKFVSKGFSCPRCSDGISYPEKFFFNVLEQMNKNFIKQLTKTTFKWCNKYKYDFYIDIYKMIIETHGRQHYEDRVTGSWEKSNSLEKIQQNDKDKEQLAKANDIKHYIVIDCRKSELEWIKKSIMQSELPTLLNFKESDINWLKCHEYACNSLVKVVCDMWNSGIKEILELCKILQLNKSTIRNYLKQGAELNWCDYISKKT